MPAYYLNSLPGFHDDKPATVLGHLIAGGSGEGFAEHKHAQTDAWTEQISVLRACCSRWFEVFPKSSEWAVLLEYPIPRRAKRIDALLLANDLIFVLEFKSGDQVLGSSDRRQVEDYCLDLRDFHSQSRDRMLIPILIQASSTSDDLRINPGGHDRVLSVQFANGMTAAECIMQIYRTNNSPDACAIDPQAWDKSVYDPTPTIIEAAQRLFAGQNVREISRSHGGVANLTKTANAVIRAVTEAKQQNKKVICFVTGVPGSGKTLAGLNVVHNPVLQTREGGLGVFLSGNGPLVKVLREALARDHAIRSGKTLHESRRRVSTFVQNVHEFIKTYVDDQPDKAPPDHVVLFDEAQRAWNVEQEQRKFKRNESEPHMMLRFMDRHEDWAVIVTLIGGGQEIHDGEAGLPEWGRTLSDGYPHWRVYISPELVRGGTSSAGEPLFDTPQSHIELSEDADLHLAVSVRSYKAESVAAWVNSVVDGREAEAHETMSDISDYPIVLTRSLAAAKSWINERTRGSRRSGLIASSGARRLKALGLDVTSDVGVVHWFLAPSEDVRSSCFLEVVATEFAVQGLELDWACLCWGADLRRTGDGWNFHRFAGTRWNRVRREVRRQYMLNKYRVLLTRARQGFIIWVPEGDQNDETRSPELYDGVAEYLMRCGVPKLASGA